MIPINGSNSSGVNLNKYVLKNVFNTVTNDLSDQVNKNKIAIEKIDVEVAAAATNDPFEWLAYDVSKEYTSEYNMKRCFNKYGDSFLIRQTSITQLQDYEIHVCEVKTDYGPNIQYKFISDYVYLPAYIRDKDNDKIIYHIAECDLIMNKETINCTAKKIEFGEGWNRVLVRYSTFEYIKINSDCVNLGIGNNSALKELDLSECYQLNSCEISNNPNFKNKCFLMKCTPSTFATSGNNNTFLDTTQNWFSLDGLWMCKFVAGWHSEDVNLYDRFNNKLRVRVNDASNDNGYYKTDINDSVINTDYFKFPSTITFSNDLYNANRTVHIPGVQVAVYTDATFETKNMTSNARILDFSNGILRIKWDNDNLVEKMIFSPALTELEIKNDTALNSINLVDCDKLTSLTIQNCPNITQVVLQHRPTTLTIDSTIKLIVLDEMNNSITTLSTRVLTLENKPQTTYSRYTIENYEVRPGDPEVQRVNEYFAFEYIKKITDNETGYIYYWDNGHKILFEAVDNDNENPNIKLLPSCPNLNLDWYEFYVSGPQNFNYNQPYTAVAGFDLSNGAITTFKIAKLDAPWDRIYIPPYVHNFEIIECFQLVGGETDPPTEIIKFPSTGFINTDTDTNKFVVKTVSLTASV